MTINETDSLIGKTINFLQPNFYISFPVKKEDYQLILVDLTFYEKFQENLNYLDRLNERREKFVDGLQMIGIYEALSEQLASPKEKMLPFGTRMLDRFEEFHLHVHEDGLTHLPPGKVATHVHLLTERFFWKWPFPNLGSSRHALLFNMQIKGLGRNPLAVRTDYVHSWGGQYFWQAVRGFVVSRILSAFAPEGFLKTTMVSIQRKDLGQRQIHHAAQSLLLRDAEAFRVAQLMTGFDPNHPMKKEKTQRLFLKRAKSSSPEEHMEKLLFHYTSMLFLGIRHMAVTRENITLEGKLIDYEDMQIDIRGNDYLFFFVVEKTNKSERLYSSSLHFYLDALELSAMGLNSLFPEFSLSRTALKKKFLKMIKLIGKSLFKEADELVALFEKMLSLEVVYNKGDDVPPASSQKREISWLQKNYDCTTILEENSYTHYHLKIPRPLFQDETIENYNHDRYAQLSDITQEVFKRLQLESFGGPIDNETALDFSSDINRLMARLALIFPYRWQKKKIQKVTETRSNLRKKYLEPLGASEIEWREDRGIVSGVLCRLQDGKEHFLFLSPTLIK